MFFTKLSCTSNKSYSFSIVSIRSILGKTSWTHGIYFRLCCQVKPSSYILFFKNIKFPNVPCMYFCSPHRCIYKYACIILENLAQIELKILYTEIKGVFSCSWHFLFFAFFSKYHETTPT